jgi:hypothetical protein
MPNMATDVRGWRFNGWARAFAAAAALLAGMSMGGADAHAQALRQPPRGFADAALGRWDLVVHDPIGEYPSWLEVRLRSEDELMGSFVGRVGSVRHVSAITFDDGELAFDVPVQYESESGVLRFTAALRGDTLIGNTTDANGEVLRFTGRRAPALLPGRDGNWGEPIALFNGRDRTGWRGRDGRNADCWRVVNGVLEARPPCVDLVTDRRFGDFRLRAEFRFPEGSNSGIYLRGRYEVQIQDDFERALDALRMGGLYGFVTPTVDATRPAGEWQSLEITLLGRYVTVVLNGTTVIDDQEIPGITGGALESDEGSPGPIMLQGDHGAIYFRSIILTPRR